MPFLELKGDFDILPHMVLIKRAYEPAQKSDGYRLLVDRLWPRGLTKKEMHLDGWPKEITPSSGLRKFFGHDPEKWVEFKKRYRKELRDNPEAQKTLEELAHIARKRDITLIYGAKDSEYTHALVLQDLIQKRMSS